MDKKLLLDEMMQDVKNCQLCCQTGQGIQPERLLKNFIAEHPNGPLYGKVPSMWTDWTNRLEAKIAIVGKDWGTWRGSKGIKVHRQQYEQRLTAVGNDDDLQIWHEMVRDYNRVDNTSQKLVTFLFESARCEEIALPTNFMDGFFVTNSVLCARANGDEFSGSENFDGIRSVKHCCHKKKFLYRQLRIVKPVMVVALGDLPMRGLGLFSSRDTVQSVVQSAQSAPQHYLTSKDGLNLPVVPVYHPSARSVNHTQDEQIYDYRFIWKALSNVLGLPVRDTVNACFQN